MVSLIRDWSRLSFNRQPLQRSTGVTNYRVVGGAASPAGEIELTRVSPRLEESAERFATFQGGAARGAERAAAGAGPSLSPQQVAVAERAASEFGGRTGRTGALVTRMPTGTFEEGVTGISPQVARAIQEHSSLPFASRDPGASAEAQHNIGHIGAVAEEKLRALAEERGRPLTQRELDFEVAVSFGTDGFGKGLNPGSAADAMPLDAVRDAEGNVYRDAGALWKQATANDAALRGEPWNYGTMDHGLVSGTVTSEFLEDAGFSPAEVEAGVEAIKAHHFTHYPSRLLGRAGVRPDFEAQAADGVISPEAVAPLQNLADSAIESANQWYRPVTGRLPPMSQTDFDRLERSPETGRLRRAFDTLQSDLPHAAREIFADDEAQFSEAGISKWLGMSKDFGARTNGDLAQSTFGEGGPAYAYQVAADLRGSGEAQRAASRETAEALGMTWEEGTDRVGHYRPLSVEDPGYARFARRVANAQGQPVPTTAEAQQALVEAFREAPSSVEQTMGVLAADEFSVGLRPMTRQPDAPPTETERAQALEAGEHLFETSIEATAFMAQQEPGTGFDLAWNGQSARARVNEAGHLEYEEGGAWTSTSPRYGSTRNIRVRPESPDNVLARTLRDAPTVARAEEAQERAADHYGDEAEALARGDFDAARGARERAGYLRRQVESLESRPASLDAGDEVLREAGARNLETWRGRVEENIAEAQSAGERFRGYLQEARDKRTAGDDLGAVRAEARAAELGVTRTQRLEEAQSISGLLNSEVNTGLQDGTTVEQGHLAEAVASARRDVGAFRAQVRSGLAGQLDKAVESLEDIESLPEADRLQRIGEAVHLYGAAQQAQDHIGEIPADTLDRFHERMATLGVEYGPDTVAEANERFAEIAETQPVRSAGILAEGGRIQSAFKYMGRIGTVVGAGYDAYRLITSDEKGRTASEIAGGWGGAALGALGAESMVAPVATWLGPVGWLVDAGAGLVGGAVGYFGGSRVGHAVYDDLHPAHSRTDPLPGIIDVTEELGQLEMPVAPRAPSLPSAPPVPLASILGGAPIG